MCGINGIILKKGIAVAKEQIKIMNDVIVHRGPDATGIYLNSNIGFGHRRLSILDLSSDGNQPMYSHDKRFVIVFNGEIYNYLEIKQELLKLGATFDNTTDTAVILEAYKYWGCKSFSRFNGMWSLAIHDIEKDIVVISRDRFGVKPLYILNNDNEFIFASEIKSILELHPEERIVNTMQFSRHIRGIKDDLDTATFFANIMNFIPGTYMEFDLKTNQFISEYYWKLDIANISKQYKGKNVYSEFKNIIEDSIKIRLRSDVPIGITLSGGLDSSAIIGIASKKYGKKMNSYSSIYQEKECNEKEFIDCMNKFTKANPHYIYPAARDVISELRKMIRFHDRPPIAASIYSSFCVYNEIDSSTKVILDGQGADELFAGYIPFYKQYFEELLEKKSFVSKIQMIILLGKFMAVWPEKINSILSDAQLFEIMGIDLYKLYLKKFRKNNPRNKSLVWNNKEILSPDFLEIACNNECYIPDDISDKLNRELYHQFFYWSLPGILHDVDGNSMSNSLEVRLPFLDYRLVEFSYMLSREYKLKGTYTKYIMRKSLGNYLPTKIRYRRHKMAFPATFDKWLREERFRTQFSELLDSFSERNVVKKEILSKYYSLHIEGKADMSVGLFRIIVAEIWLQEMIDTNAVKWRFCKEKVK